MTKYILAHDIGTSGNKASLFSTEGEAIKNVTINFDTNYMFDNRAEQNPLDWWKAVCESTKQLLSNINKSNIAAVSFSGQMMGCLCVDKQGQLLRDSIIYSDQRSVEETKIISSKIEQKKFYKICGHRASPVYSLEKLMWIKKNEPDIYKKTFKMLNAKDYLIFRLTGKYCTDHSDASGTNAYDIRLRNWSSKIIDIADIEQDKFPEIYDSTTVIGEVSKKAAEETSIPIRTPVVIGAGDGSSAGVGVGCISPGNLYSCIGTSAWIATTTTEPFYDEKMQTMTWAHAIPNLYHPSGSMQAAGACYRWIRDEICKDESSEGYKRGINPYQIIDKEVESSVAGANGIIFLPYLMGERSPYWNPKAKGAFIGIKLTNKKEDLLRAVVEGVCFNLKTIFEIFSAKSKYDHLTLVGGVAKGGIWQQILADILGVKVLIPNYLEEATSIGAAVIGGVGIGELKDFKDVNKFIKINKVIKPNIEAKKVYKETHKIFKETYLSLLDIFNKI